MSCFVQPIGWTAAACGLLLWFVRTSTPPSRQTTRSAIAVVWKCACANVCSLRSDRGCTQHYGKQPIDYLCLFVCLFVCLHFKQMQQLLLFRCIPDSVVAQGLCDFEQSSGICSSKKELGIATSNPGCHQINQYCKKIMTLNKPASWPETVGSKTS